MFLLDIQISIPFEFIYSNIAALIAIIFVAGMLAVAIGVPPRELPQLGLVLWVAVPILLVAVVFNYSSGVVHREVLAGLSEDFNSSTVLSTWDENDALVVPEMRQAVEDVNAQFGGVKTSLSSFLRECQEQGRSSWFAAYGDDESLYGVRVVDCFQREGKLNISYWDPLWEKTE